MNKTGFVVLHYITLEETVQCVESIISKVSEPYIVIVDNCSPNGTGAMLREKYAGTEIDVIILSENMGFARGNNAGIRKARENGCEYVVVLNNDTEIIQDDFVQEIDRQYSEYGYAVMGPMIYKGGVPTNDNPGRDHPMSEGKAYAFALLNGIMLLLSYLMHVDIVLDKLFNIYVNKQKSSTIITENVENVALHGCCLIFTPSFFKCLKGFHSGTYMYMEEDLLYQQLEEYNLLSCYIPALHIEHKEGISTNNEYPGVKKRRFRYINNYKSSLIIAKERRIYKKKKNRTE